MRAGFQDTIYLTNLETLIFLALYALVVFLARPEIGLGIYLAMAGWTRTVQIGPIAHTWVLWATILLASLVMIAKDKQLRFFIPKQNRWILSWMVLWWGWMIMLFILYKNMFDPGLWASLLKNVVLYVLFPLPFIALFTKCRQQIMEFAVGYIVFAMLGGWYALQVIHIPLGYVFSDPTLLSYGVLRLNLINYHWFAYLYAISLIFLLSFFFWTKNFGLRLLIMVTAICCLYFLIISGSRQAMLGAFVALLIYGIWLLKSQGLARLWILVIVIPFIFVSIWLVNDAPLLVRLGTNNSRLVLDVDLMTKIIRDRQEITWDEGLKAIPHSPLWGVGFSLHAISHNLFIGTLVDQGLIGMVFLLGFLIFWWREAWRVWNLSRITPDNLWRVALSTVMVFVLVQSQFSGSPVSEWAMWWSTTFLWCLSEKLSSKQVQQEVEMPVGPDFHPPFAI